jgi:hypothetical protein
MEIWLSKDKTLPIGSLVTWKCFGEGKIETESSLYGMIGNLRNSSLREISNKIDKLSTNNIEIKDRYNCIDYYSKFIGQFPIP